MSAPLIAIDPIILMYAFRYTLGRRTIAMSQIQDALMANREALGPAWRAQIVRDIDRAIDGGRLTQDAWRMQWLVVREFMRDLETVG